MALLNIILDILHFEVKVPRLYGGFHLAWLAASFFIAVYCAVRYPKLSESSLRRGLLISSLVVIGLEVYKQIVFTFSFGDKLTIDYQWYIFPFQFCSTPMYVGLAAALVRSRKIYNCLCAYLATFSFFAGLAVMFYPSTVFTDTLGVNIQTMVCHGMMVSTGVYLLFSGHVKPNLKTLLRAMPVFIVLLASAMAMNEAAYRAGIIPAETFNMFFISPYCAPSLPVYSLVQAVVPYPVSVIVYFCGFTLAAGIVLAMCALIQSRIRHQ